MPRTAAMGIRAAITVKVAKIVGLPTSRTASMEIKWQQLSSSSHRRYIFSTTTIASSTKIPMENMRANRLTRSIVKLRTQAEKTVIRITTGITTKVTIAGLKPKAYQTRRVTAEVATTNLKSSSLTFSLAVSP